MHLLFYFWRMVLCFCQQVRQLIVHWWSDWQVILGQFTLQELERGDCFFVCFTNHILVEFQLRHLLRDKCFLFAANEEQFVPHWVEVRQICVVWCVLRLTDLQIHVAIELVHELERFLKRHGVCDLLQKFSEFGHVVVTSMYFSYLAFEW